MSEETKKIGFNVKSAVPLSYTFIVLQFKSQKDINVVAEIHLSDLSQSLKCINDVETAVRFKRELMSLYALAGIKERQLRHTRHDYKNSRIGGK